jgi:hypothetical protein
VLPKKTSRRKCSEYEREWRGFCVDRNLEDDWLQRLNGLDTFDLISICEGHCGRQTEPSRTPPHIKLRLKERYLSGIASHWDTHKMAILGTVNGLFQGGDTYVNLELKFKLRSGTGRLSYQEEMIMRVHGRQARSVEEMGPVTRAWFQQSVERIEEADQFITSLWQSESEQ